MHQIVNSPSGRAWIWAAVAGFLLFLFIQVFPNLWSYDATAPATMSRAKAAEAALRAAQDRFGLSKTDVKNVAITHTSDTDAVAYFSKENLLRKYENDWSRLYPTDVYRADMELATGPSLTLFLQMETGKLVGWQDNTRQPAVSQDGNVAPDAAATAFAYAAHWGIRQQDWEAATPLTRGVVSFVSRKSSMGDAHLQLKVQVPQNFNRLSSAFPPWRGGFVMYNIGVPAALTSYLAAQKSAAGSWNLYGFVLPELMLLILAIVYAAVRRQYTSFRRGIFLSILFFGLYAAFYLNLIPGFRAGAYEQGVAADFSTIVGILIINLIVLAGMAALTYFSAVGGDGLWKSMGRSLWPRWGETGFGTAVRDGMKRGYLLAFILLGVQSVILLALEHGIGMFQSSDPSQSSYNMTFPWMLILLAWCAGISEELQSRFFGIGLFRHWFTAAARSVLGREPSRRAASGLTIAAMLPPTLIWAFGHVGYAVYPFYSRLIELLVMGLLFGWFMLRFGLITVIFAHIVLDSVLMSTQMVFDRLPGDLAAGLIALVLPAAVGYAIWWLHKRRRASALPAAQPPMAEI